MASGAVDAAPGPLFVVGTFSVLVVACALQVWGAGERTDKEQEAVAAYREALKENTRERICTLHIDAIAALAGCSRSVAQNALRQARLLDLVLVKERRPAESHEHRLDYLEGMDRLAKLG